MSVHAIQYINSEIDITSPHYYWLRAEGDYHLISQPLPVMQYQDLET